ncbi:guanylate kinase [Candidatus Babeliales bacterium]|nr:guanylate kinase [Candidatus Babeliales bacterium]
MEKKDGKIFIVSAPSGTGKTTLVNSVLGSIGNKYNISKVITYTNRKPRPGEKDGVDYNFISPEEFNEKMKDNFFLETTIYSDKYYGSPALIKEELKLGKSFVLLVNREGTKSVCGLLSNPVTIWLEPPSLEVLKSRLLKRGDSHSQIEKRLNLAEQELKEEKNHRLFKYHIINDVFNKAADGILQIVETELSRL